MKYNLGEMLRVIQAFHSIENVNLWKGDEFTIIAVDYNLLTVYVYINSTSPRTVTITFADIHINCEPLCPISLQSSSSPTPPPQTQYTGSSLQNAFTTVIIPDDSITKECHCGCSSIGTSKHSDYCPLYSKE